MQTNNGIKLVKTIVKVNGNLVFVIGENVVDYKTIAELKKL
jgi:hypothetical protein